MALISSSYPIMGSNVPLQVVLKGPDPFPLDGDSATFYFDFSNPLDRSVTMTMEGDVNLLGTGAFANKIQAVSYERKHLSGSWVAAANFTIGAGETMEFRANVDFTVPAQVGEQGGFAILGSED